MLNKIVLSYNYMVTSFNFILAKISSSPGSLLEADIWNETITPALSVLQLHTWCIQPPRPRSRKVGVTSIIKMADLEWDFVNNFSKIGYNNLDLVKRFLRLLKAKIVLLKGKLNQYCYKAIQCPQKIFRMSYSVHLFH